jgi:type VI secretion system protein ImpJ
MIARQKALAAGRRERGSSGSVEFGAADVQALWMLQALNSTIHVLRHAHERGWVAPEQLYVELARLCGQLFTLRFEGDPTSVPGFNYTELGATFRALFDLLEKLVGIDLGDALTSIPLEQKQPGFYLGRVGDSKLFDHAAFYLGVGGEVAETILRDRIPRLVKVGSADQISQIIGAALPGVRAEIDYRPPGCIPVRSGNIYLRLEKSGAYWDRIRSTGTIAIYQPLEPARLRLELLAIAEAG